MFGRKRQIVEAGCRLCPCQVSLEAGCSDIDIKQTNDTQQAAVHAPARTAQTQGIRHRGASPWQSQSRHRSLPLPTRGAHLDLSCAPYGLYGVKYIDLVSPTPLDTQTGQWLTP